MLTVYRLLFNWHRDLNKQIVTLNVLITRRHFLLSATKHMHIFCHAVLYVSTGTDCLCNVTAVGDGNYT